MSFDLCFWHLGTGSPDDIYDEVCEGDSHRLDASEQVLAFREALLDRWTTFRDCIEPSDDDDDPGRPAGLDRYVLLTIPDRLLGETSEILELARAHHLTGYDPQAEQELSPYTATEDDLRERQQVFDDAERHGRVDQLEILLADDFVSIGERGYVLDKTAWIARFTEFRYLSREITETEVRRYDRTAVIRCVQRTQAVWQGQTLTLGTRVSLVWIAGSDGWKLVSLQFSSLPDS